MQSEDMSGFWVFCPGSPSRPSRRVHFTPEHTVVSIAGEEKYWYVANQSLLLLDSNRIILWIFDLATGRDGCLIGRSRQAEFYDSTILLVREGSVVARPAGQRLPLQVGPLPAQANSHAEFVAAWRSRDDFSVVLAPEGHYIGRKPLSLSRNLGQTPHSDKYEEVVLRHAPGGYLCRPVFFHVLNDCLLLDGSVVVTHDGRAIFETTEFPGMEPQWDTDYSLAGSVIRPGSAEISLTGEPSQVFDFDVFLLSTLKVGYGHWLGQSVPNAVTLDWIRDAAPDVADHLALSVLGGITRENFRIEGLRLLSLANPVIVPPRGVVRCRRLVVPSFHRYGHHWPGIGAVFRKMAVRARELMPEAPRRSRIYASRAGHTRGFVNDAAIEPVLKKHGFKPLVGGTIPYVEQIAVYAEAEAVFGSHGSNMSNISFCPPAACALEVFDDLTNDPFWYYFLANASQLDYSYIVTATPPEQQSLGFVDRSLDLPPDVLDAVLTAGFAR
jgi:hypothetical protein